MADRADYEGMPQADQLLRGTAPHGRSRRKRPARSLRQAEIAASILLRGTQGFGLRQHLRTDRSLTLSEDLPLLTVAVDARPRIEAVLEQTLAMTTRGW